MSCLIGINRISLTIPEAELVGIFCHIIDIFGDQLSNHLFNVEISYINNGTLLPKFPERSWTLYQKLSAIKSYCDSLKYNKDEGSRSLTVIPIGIDKLPQKYYLKEEYENDFILGYDLLTNILRVNHEPIEYLNYQDHFEPDFILISQCKLNKQRNYVINLPCYLWDLPMYTDKYNEQITVDLINLFLRDCHDYDHQLLFNGNTYLRIMCYQDRPDADRYCYIYIRKIAHCTFDSHKKSLSSIPKDKLPCEINFANDGYFYHFPLLEWDNKYVNHIKQFD